MIRICLVLLVSGHICAALSLTSKLLVFYRNLPSSPMWMCDLVIDIFVAAVPCVLPQSLMSQAVTTPKGAQVLVSCLPDVDAKALQEAATTLLSGLGDPGAVVLGTVAGDKCNFVAAFSPQVREGGGGNGVGILFSRRIICNGS